MNAKAHAMPSEFYALLEDATSTRLVYPVDGKGEGPFWDAQGSIDARCQQWEDEDVSVVILGQGRYRLAEKEFGPFSSLGLHWGDEFFAQDEGDGTLRLLSVAMPRRFTHYRFWACGGRLNNEHPLAELLHGLGGGWECVAQGLLTLTVPVEHSPVFQSQGLPLAYPFLLTSKE